MFTSAEPIGTTRFFEYNALHSLAYGTPKLNSPVEPASSARSDAKTASTCARVGDVGCLKTSLPCEVLSRTRRPTSHGFARATFSNCARSASEAATMSPEKKVMVAIPVSYSKPPASSRISSTSVVSGDAIAVCV